jgi:hypothetical protein
MDLALDSSRRGHFGTPAPLATKWHAFNIHAATRDFGLPPVDLRAQRSGSLPEQWTWCLGLLRFFEALAGGRNGTDFVVSFHMALRFMYLLSLLSTSNRILFLFEDFLQRDDGE